MKTRSAGLLLLLGIAMMMTACGEKGDEVEFIPPLTVIMPDTSYFPNKEGYWWKYLMVSDSDSSLVTVRVEGDTVIGGDSCKIWKYLVVGDDGEETLWFRQAVSTRQDTLRMTNLLTGSTQVLILPLVTGAAWINPLDDTDSTLVLGLETVCNDSATYDDAYHLVRYRQAWVYSYEYDYWFEPKVGMVRIHEFSSWTGPVGSSEATWDLIARHFFQVSGTYGQ